MARDERVEPESAPPERYRDKMPSSPERDLGMLSQIADNHERRISRLEREATHQKTSRIQELEDALAKMSQKEAERDKTRFALRQDWMKTGIVLLVGGLGGIGGVLTLLRSCAQLTPAPVVVPIAAPAAVPAPALPPVVVVAPDAGAK